MSIYALKPRFQSLLRPVVVRLYGMGVTANHVTVSACVVSVTLGIGLFLLASAPSFARQAFWIIPVWMFLRMAFNAIDGMLAREHHQRSNLGAYLNELTDIVSDAALYLPFAQVPPFSGFWVGVTIVVAGLSEFGGALGPTVGASRRYDGPMGKSDRAFVFGALGLYVALGWPLPSWVAWLMPFLAALVAWTTVNRVRYALHELESAAQR